MFKIAAEKTELNQISLTGVRAIVLVGLLIIKPRSLEEIRRALTELQIMDESHSDDILRIDLNTLKVMGCEISRSSAKTNFKYVLTKHPFSLKLEDDELHALKRVYNHLKREADISILLEYHDLFTKIAFHICDEKAREAILGISSFKYYDIKMVKELISDCKRKRILEIIYKKPTSNKEDKKEIIAQEMVVKNDKIYLYGYDLEKDESIVLNVRRLKAIVARKLNKDGLDPVQTRIRFLLKDLRISELDDNEEVVDSTIEGYIVDGVYHNEFVATQRIMSLGYKCVVLEPIDFRNKIISKIKEMRNTYER